MKFVLGLFIAVVALTFVNVEAKMCHDDDDCEANQCCIGLLFFGECRNLEPDNDRCSVQTHGGNLHQGYCPCQGELICQRVEEESGIFGGIAVNHTRCAKAS